MSTATETRYRLLGINDDESTCTLCGRKELKAVYWLEDLTNGDVFHVGRTCGPRLLKCTSAAFRSFEKDETKRQRAEAQTWIRTQPAALAYRAKLEELNATKLMGKERMDVITPFVTATNVLQEQARKLWPLAGYLYA